MTITRRRSFKALTAMGGLVGLSGISEANAKASATSSPVGERQVSIEWLGHGSFLFISCSGKRILFDPWISTNPKCPGKYRQAGGFSSVDLILWTHGHVDHFMLPDARSLITRHQPKIIARCELIFFIKSEILEANCQTFTIGNKGCTAKLDGLKITMLEAFHSAVIKVRGLPARLYRMNWVMNGVDP